MKKKKKKKTGENEIDTPFSFYYCKLIFIGHKHIYVPPFEKKKKKKKKNTNTTPPSTTYQLCQLFA